MNLGKTWMIAVAILLILAVPGIPVRAHASPVSPGSEPQVSARAAILIDANSGQVLWQRNASQRLPMASVTKLMTLVLAMRAIEQGKASLRDWVPVSHEAYRTKGSQIWLEPGERLTLKQMLTAIAVGSANDAAVAVAEFLGGTTERFVALMNEEAQRLGMTNTHFANPHGLPALEHYSTARDLSLLAERAVKMPKLLAMTSQWQDRTIRNGKGGTLWLVNQNRLLRTYPGTDGLKTGYTSEAGFCLVATAVRGPTRMIAVILGAPSSRARFEDAANLMSWGFAHFTTVPLVKRGDVLGRVKVLRGVHPTVMAVAGRTLTLTMPRGPSQAITQSLTLSFAVGAPVHAGQRLGTLTVRQGTHVLSEVPLVAQNGVRAVTLPELAWQYFWRIIA